MKMPLYSVSSFLPFCLQPTLGKDTWMRATSVTVMVTFSKVPFWKLLDHNYVQSSFSTITRHIDNSILKENLKLKILQTWIQTKIHANSFIKTWVNIMKRKSTNYHLQKNRTQHFKRYCTKIDDISLIVILPFLSNKPSV